MLSGGALAVVLVAEHNPVNAGLFVLSRHLGHAAVLAGVLVLDCVHLLVLGVDGRDQEVVGDVLGDLK